ncbi:MAG: diguanylate cyclase domain-containing protein [Methylobacter sp.]
MDKSNIYNNLDAQGVGRADTIREYLSQQNCQNDITNLKQSPLMLSERAELIGAIAAKHQQLKAAQQQIEALKETNAYLKQKLIRIAKKYAHTRHYGNHDELTGLPTRSVLLDRLKQTMVLATRQNRQVALLFIDLDKFKNVNDTLGHTAGDKLLQEVAQRLIACIRHGDTACRYGGDEFVVLLPDIDRRETALAVAEKIRNYLTGSYVIEGNVLEVTVSIGTSVVRADGQNYSDLINQADMAMYLAKAEKASLTPSF